MKISKQIRTIFIILCALSSKEAFCVESSTVLRIPIPIATVSNDPHRLDTAYSMFVAMQQHAGLFRFSSEGIVVPNLVESWSSDSTSRKYRFKLKQAKFSNGESILPQHVIWSFARIFALESPSSIAPDLMYISGSKKFQETLKITDLGIRAIDSNTIEFSLNSKTALFFKHLATVDCSIIPISDEAQFRKSLRETTQDVGIGPYISDTKTQEAIKLRKWQSSPLDSTKPPARIEFYLNNNSPVDAALNGFIDVLDSETINTATSQKLIEKGWNRYATALTTETFILMNPQRIPKRVRMKAFVATNPTAIHSALNIQGTRPMFGLIPFGIRGALSSNDLSEVQQKSKAPSKSESEMNPTLYFPTNNELAAKVAQEVRKSLSHQNLTVNLKELSRERYLAKIRTNDFEMILRTRGLDYFDGLSVLSYLRTQKDENYYLIRNQEIDTLLNKATMEIDENKRTELYQNIQKMALEEYNILPLISGSTAAGLWGSTIKNVPAHPGGLHTLPLESVEMK